MIQEAQASRILRHLEAGKSITPLDALQKWGCFRLGARIWDLKRMGYRINKRMVAFTNGKRCASYSMGSS